MKELNNCLYFFKQVGLEVDVVDSGDQVARQTTVPFLFGSR